ncbi:MAG: hypothetical protein QM766_02325 [Burkholderiaceae bacterium]
MKKMTSPGSLDRSRTFHPVRAAPARRAPIAAVAARAGTDRPCASRSAIGLAAALFCAGMLAACGGGGGSDGPAASGALPPVDGGATPQPKTTSVPVTVIDGPIKNAVVCVDVNLNGGCDAGEPTGTTGDDGTTTLQVPDANVGRYPIVAVVGTDAVDRDHGPVTQPFTMRAPASRGSVVSPLTTLVQAQVDAAGLGVDEAASFVQSGLGLSQSVFSDFTAGSDAGSARAGAVARLLAVITQQQNAALQPAVGTTDTSGSTITRQDLDTLIAQALLARLPSLADALANRLDVPADQRASAIASAAADLVGESGLSVDKVAAVVGGNRLIAQAASNGGATVPEVGWNVRWFQFADVDHWFVRANETTAAQAVPDADGLLRYTDNRIRKTGAGDEQTWGDPMWPRNDLFWDGARWWNCPAGFENTMTPRDADGVSRSTYCKTIPTTSRRGVRDIGGKKMVDVVREIRAYPLPDPFGADRGGWANWGPDPDSGVLGTEAFPAGSKLYFLSFTDFAYPDAYDPADPNNELKLSMDVSAGGPIGTCPNDPPPPVAAASFDQMIAHSGGVPCAYAPRTVAGDESGERNEWWGNSTVRIALLGNAYTERLSSFYTYDQDLRVAFGADGKADFYACRTRASNGSPRNCDPVSSGRYAIETLGDSRVMRFSGVPAQLGRLGYDRIFVERGGRVYAGSRTKPVSGNSIRLNEVAAKALFIKLGLPQLADD